MTSRYYIFDGYVERLNNLQHDDRGLTDGYQKEVYEHAKALADWLKVTHVLDIGCGSGYKLLKNFSDYVTFGFELEPNLSWLIQNYPQRHWLQSDLDLPSPVQGGLLICSDVIEHIPDPDRLMRFIASVEPQKIVLSTPEREMLEKLQHPHWVKNGPPVNPAHVREWSFKEFEIYVHTWFDIDEHFISNAQQGTQCLVASLP